MTHHLLEIPVGPRVVRIGTEIMVLRVNVGSVGRVEGHPRADTSVHTIAQSRDLEERVQYDCPPRMTWIALTWTGKRLLASIPPNCITLFVGTT